ncbi:hypothetical protein AVDCRST_MAG94-3217 [uncultured Leptolyngbya sp.]|uniref:Uncharacterized protein n=1 Tax=uncultured Leptolyngbya sp. TaxID=332963 RepID=A0A6J4MI38_9CYAN|nr:hypothetical protein AVDCRST_MAG94-3217 [uncultured Leptolyngbya sp.]
MTAKSGSYCDAYFFLASKSSSNYKRQKTAAFDWNPRTQRLLVLLTKDEL